MDILIRVIVMILSGISLPFIANAIYEPVKKFNELNIVEKIIWGLVYFFIVNWFIIIPSIWFVECFKYIFI